MTELDMQNVEFLQKDHARLKELNLELWEACKALWVHHSTVDPHHENLCELCRIAETAMVKGGN